MTEMIVESDVDRAIREQLERDVSPNWRIPVQHATWMRLERFGVDETQRGIDFVDANLDVSQAMRRAMGWWVCNIEGWVSYTEWRDIQISEMSGEGRPWLHRLAWLTRMRIFREFVLLLHAWNRVVRDEAHIVFWLDEDPELPTWAKRWLSLTNESFDRGPAELERKLWDALKVDDSTSRQASVQVQGVVEQYMKSRATWRLMMPNHAEFHRRYGDRGEYWTFER